MLSGYRALDLTDEKGFFCGKILGELGVDVIKIERPGGDPGRNIGPFYGNTPDPEKSLYWFAYNDSKRGITLNLEAPEGQEIFRTLAKTAHFVIESFPVGYMDKVGLGYEQLSKLNPKIIVTSITPFGQTGPWKHYKATDIILMATSGLMMLTGEPDGVPTRYEPDHSYCFVGSDAVVGALIAHYYCVRSGEGQHVDISMHECMVRANYNYAPMSYNFGPIPKRTGSKLPRGHLQTPVIHKCKDGYVSWLLFAGIAGAEDNRRITKWMDDEGIPTPGEIKGIDWDKFKYSDITQKEVDLIEERISTLTSRYTKGQLEEQALKRGVRMNAVNDVKDLFKNEQLKFRNFWGNIEHPELSASITYPSQLYQTTETQARARFRAPQIGEHNKQIYEEELGFSKQKVEKLQQLGVI
jgi:crotonobetainyl-CoA:carnitine CoA-transferase CaiB-like acyl-CoA transferase